MNIKIINIIFFIGISLGVSLISWYYFRSPEITGEQLKKMIQESNQNSADSWWLLSETESGYTVALKRVTSRSKYYINKNEVIIDFRGRKVSIPANIKKGDIVLKSSSSKNFNEERI